MCAHLKKCVISSQIRHNCFCDTNRYTYYFCTLKWNIHTYVFKEDTILIEKSISFANRGSVDGVVIFSSALANLVVSEIFSVSFDLFRDDSRFVT